MVTRAMQVLKQRGIPFRVQTYDHEKKGVEFAAAALGYPVERTIKTLVVELTPGGPVFVLMPGHRQLDLKMLARSAGAKKAAMAEAGAAEHLTGYRVGGISPFGGRRALPLYMDAELLEHAEVAVNGGNRGVMLLLSPVDILKVTGGRILGAAGTAAGT